MFVTGERVNLREGAGTQYGVTSVARRGMSFEWVATAGNGWYAIRFGGMVGWISPKYSEVRAV